MPATGKVQGHSMISMFATDSEAGSAITMVNPGKNNVPLYGLAFKFHYRQVYSMTMSKNGEVFDQYEEEIGIGDACVNYYFDNRSEAEEEFTYVDLAVRVREKLQESWIDDFGVENKSSGEDGAIVNLKVFLGAENSTGGLIDTFEVLTSFEQVKEIYETLRGVGVDQIRISLLGWQSDGYFGNICDKFPAESALGGDEDLKKLLAWAGENNIEMALEYNSLLMYGSPTSGITLREAVVKSPATTYQEFNLTFPSGVWRSWDPFYYMSPLFYEREMLDDDIARLKEYGLNSLDVLTVGTELFSDYNKANALTRQQSMHHYVNWMKKYKENFDNVSVYYLSLIHISCYPLSKHKFPGRNGMLSMVTTALMFVTAATQVPNYLIYTALRLPNTYWVYIIPALASPMAVFLMKQFLDQVPNEIFEAGKIDGASEWQLYTKIAIPLLRNAQALSLIHI